MRFFRLLVWFLGLSGPTDDGDGLGIDNVATHCSPTLPPDEKEPMIRTEHKPVSASVWSDGIPVVEVYVNAHPLLKLISTKKIRPTSTYPSRFAHARARST
ncbi:hypothetical protein EDD15DRAFT_1135873 [Pisolithus albus]|nr:hypothetical protein EDD15DRAFT_1135873 [Pisolithus albus]